MIPKIIHFCWFGHNEKPKIVKKCLKSWRKFCPDYQIIEWNEDCFDIASAPLFVQQAIEEKKWAFATDYIRLKVVYDHGGIYLDTDVELIKSLDALLNNHVYFGFEHGNNGRFVVASGVGFGAEKGAMILSELMGVYEKIPFVLPDGILDMTICPARETKVLQRHGLKLDGTEQYLENEIHIYPVDYFCPLKPGEILTKRTSNTVSIHWYSTTWFTKQQRRKRTVDHLLDFTVHIPNRLGMKILGNERYQKVKRFLKGHR